MITTVAAPLTDAHERKLAARATLCGVIDWMRGTLVGRSGPMPDPHEAAAALDVLLDPFPQRDAVDD